MKEMDPIIPLPAEGEAWRIVYTINRLVERVNELSERVAELEENAA